MFNQKKIKIAFNIMLILIGVFAITQVGLATPFVIGGVILQGILGGFSGKVGPVVGAKWKEIDYMRSYVIPSNPNTAGQQTQRTRFAAAVAFARDLLGGLLQPFWDPFVSNMSGFNKWISENIGLMTVGNILDATAIMSKGTLEGDVISAAEYTTGSGVLEISWTGTITGNGLAQDLPLIVVYSKLSNDLQVFTPVAERGDTLVQVNPGAGQTATDLYCYLSFFRGTGSNLVVSDSYGSVCAAP